MAFLFFLLKLTYAKIRNMEKGKPSIYDKDNSKQKNENPFNATNPPGKKRNGVHATRIWAVATDTGENLKVL